MAGRMDSAVCTRGVPGCIATMYGRAGALRAALHRVAWRVTRTHPTHVTTSKLPPGMPARARTSPHLSCRFLLLCRLLHRLLDIRYGLRSEVLKFRLAHDETR